MENIHILLLIGILYTIWCIVELYNLHRFNISFFNKGLKVYTSGFCNKLVDWENLNSVVSSDSECKYAFFESIRKGCFVTKFTIFKRTHVMAYSWGIPLTIYGIISEFENKVRVSFYISFRLAILVVMLNLFFIITVLFSGSWMISFVFLTLLILASVIFYQVVLFQKRRINRISKEILFKLKNVNEHLNDKPLIGG